MRGVCLLVLICGCRSILGIEDVNVIEGPLTDADDGDAFNFVDAPVDGANPGQLCFGAHAVRVCVDPQVVDFAMPSLIDTSVDASCTLVQPQSGPPSLCVIAAKNITRSQGTTRVVGSRPLVLLATENITISGTIDAASHNVAGGAGPGANTGTCGTPGNGESAAGNGGGGGGAGGALTSSGGSGGTGSGGANGGAQTPTLVVTILRGGCKGGKGGQIGGSTAGLPGNGGGAIYLLAGASITVTGAINASGATANGSDARCGGSGGGSGGMIGLEAPAIQVATDAKLYAIGGGGAPGGSANAGGSPGAEATGPAPTQTTFGMDGAGIGAAGQPLAGANGGNTTTAGAGGGGGGGGGGRIWMTGSSTTGMIQPPATAPP